MSSCKLCTDRKDCWVKTAIELSRPLPSSPRDLQIVMAAAAGDCPLYKDRRDEE